MPRPRLDLDAELIRDLAFLGLSNRQIAHAVRCSDTTIGPRRPDLEAAIDQGRQVARVVLEEAWLAQPHVQLREPEYLARVARLTRDGE